MINKVVLSELKPIVSDPGWKIIIEKMEYLKSRALNDIITSKDFESFLKAKGAYQLSERVVELFKNPTLLADDGIARFPGTLDVMGTHPTQ